MKINRRKFVIVLAGAIVVILALFGILNIAARLSTSNVDTKEGRAMIEDEENQDVQAIENKIHRMEAEENKAEDETSKRTAKNIFVNSVVMGDAIAQGFADYDILDVSNVIAKKGITLDQLDDAVQTVVHMNPDAIFLTYGINDVVATNGDTSLFQEEYQALIDQLQKELPNSRIFVNGIFPVQKAQIKKQPAYRHIDKYNEVLETICNKEQISYIDNSDPVADRYYDSDGICFVKNFYPVWADHMAEVASL
ncbi:MAG: GDSL-type esterase/lipase family protein [Hespellia sp.]|nr:GDSL-type esterase/lipase family protein [Hespellia sp.]